MSLARLTTRVAALALVVAAAACIPPPPQGDAGDDGGAAPVDGGGAPVDGGGAPVDAGSVFIDGGSFFFDGGVAQVDGGMSLVDGGVGPIDAGACILDAGCDGMCAQLPADPDARAYCVDDVVPFTNGCTDGGLGGCCTNDDCPTDGGTGVCTSFSYRYCGGAAPPDDNVCRYDDCASDFDCPSTDACLPRGAFGSVTALCVVADCRADDDCVARAGGMCLPLSTGVCGTVGGFYCTYDDDVCRRDGDCTGSFETCEPGDGGTVCVEHLPNP